MTPSSDEAALELDDLGVGAGPLLDRGEPFDSLDQHPAVPAAVEHAHPAEARDLAPEPPQEVVTLLAPVGLGVGVHGEVARVERLDDTADRTALAAGVDALDHDQQAGSDVFLADLAAEGEPEFDEPLLRRRQPLLVLVSVPSFAVRSMSSSRPMQTRR